MTIPVDYEILRLIWWLFLGVLLIGFAVVDGFDLGVAMLLPYVARRDTERRASVPHRFRPAGTLRPLDPGIRKKRVRTQQFRHYLQCVSRKIAPSSPKPTR